MTSQHPLNPAPGLGWNSKEGGEQRVGKGVIKGRGRRGSSCPTPSLADHHILHLGLSLFQGESFVQLGAAYKRRPAPMMPSTLCGSSALVSGLQILLEGDYLLLLLLLLYQHPSKPFSWKPC